MTSNRQGQGTALILIVEDNPKDAELLEKWLGRAGYETVVERSVIGAEDALLNGKMLFDVVILDLVLGDSSIGAETFKRVKRALDGQAIEIIIWTGTEITVPLLRRFEGVGAFSVLGKNAEPYDLLAAVSDALKVRASVKATRKESPFAGTSIPATQIWVESQMKSLELKLAPIVEWAKIQKEEHERAQERAANRRALLFRPSDWPQVIKLAVLVLGYMGYDLVRHPEPAPVIVQPEPAPEAPASTPAKP